MDIAMIGLGRMGGNMARRLSRGGHRVVAYNRTADTTYELAKAEANVTAITMLAELAQQLKPPRAVWLMVPAGDPTDKAVQALTGILSPGDVIVDGGNTNYKDDMRRAELLKPTGIDYVDVGTSGGIWGLAEGYSMMIGGDKTVVQRLRPIFETLAPAPDKGWGHVGPTGAGHFVKMIHNGIEYGMMQAYAEGFEIMKKKKEFNLDLADIARIWQHGSVVRSWLLDLTVNALTKDQNLTHIQGYVADSGEGRWTVAEAIDLDVPAPIISLSLLMRFVSRQDESYAAKLLAALRNEFGGHAVKSE
jgi:6-phosphogluconate dehydrogenase